MNQLLLNQTPHHGDAAHATLQAMPHRTTILPLRLREALVSLLFVAATVLLLLVRHAAGISKSVAASVASFDISSRTRGTAPFVVLFESGSGSSWLIQELAAHPKVCIALFEPIDNASLAREVDHAARLRWLELLFTPPYSAEGIAWRKWRRNVEEASVFGQLPIISASLAQCSLTATAFGLKARLSRLLTSEAAMRGLRELMARLGVRVIRLSRRNRIKQALAEYRRLYAGLGHFKATKGQGGMIRPAGSAVSLPHFRRSLKEVERSHRLASRVIASLAPGQPVLTIDYEDLFSSHREAITRIEKFLDVDPEQQNGNAQRGRAAYQKATPDRLCAAVSNYADLCDEYSARSEYTGYFEDPCDTECG
jgi:hypothetical protein